jgi:hypothetical protein
MIVARGQVPASGPATAIERCGQMSSGDGNALVNELASHGREAMLVVFEAMRNDLVKELGLTNSQREAMIPIVSAAGAKIMGIARMTRLDRSLDDETVALATRAVNEIRDMDLMSAAGVDGHVGGTCTVGVPTDSGTLGAVPEAEPTP